MQSKKDYNRYPLDAYDKNSSNSKPNRLSRIDSKKTQTTIIL
jgi:hypothetical protein